MHEYFLVGAPSLLGQLRGDCFRAINARAQHVEVLLRAFAAFPQVANLRAGTGNDLQQVVQFAGRF